MTKVIRYFYVPSSRIVPMPEKPKRVQTVLSHERRDPATGLVVGSVNTCDPATEPVLQCDPEGRDPQHNVEVFYEDRTHDWTWDQGNKAIRYFSRVATYGVWIRCEF